MRIAPLLFFVTLACGQPADDRTDLSAEHDETELAESPPAESVDDARYQGLAKARGAFVGRVMQIETRRSLPARGAPAGLPHTFITYEVEEGLFGAQAGDTLTIRHPGGPWGDGTEMINPGAPVLRVGDRALLNLMDNGETVFPYLAHSTLRLTGDRALLDDGSRLRVDDRGQLWADPPGAPEGLRPGRLDEEAVLGWVRAAAQELHPQGEPALASARTEGPFTMPDILTELPPGVSSPDERPVEELLRNAPSTFTGHPKTAR